MNKKINRTIEELRQEIVSYAQSLIRFPSTSGNETEAQEYVRDTFVHLDATHVDLWEPEYSQLLDHPAFISSRENFTGSPNVAGTWKGKGGGKNLILCSHIDVVPEGNHEEWTYPPFAGEVADGKIYGRGVSDMKGTMACMFMAMQAIKKLDIKLKGDVTIISTIEEETGSAGALSAVMRGYSADAAIIPEPTGFRICPAQQGGARFAINLRGKSAHAGQRYNGVSAIEKSDLVRAGIVRYEKYLNEHYKTDLYKDNKIPFTINIGVFRSGEWFCTVPENAYMEGRMAIPPGMNLQQAFDNLRAFIDEAIKEDSWLVNNPPTINRHHTYWEPAQIPLDHPIIATAKEEFRNIFEQDAHIVGTSWGTDGRMFTEFGNTPALVFGPGTTAHCPDESIPIEDLVQYTKILTNIIIEWCGVA